MAPPPHDYAIGQMVPGTVYRVTALLGAGGMGAVYDVEDTSVGRHYVLKTLHGTLADRADLAARLAREARVLAKLQHPNIVEVYTSGTTQDALRLPYYVMEKLNGQSLRAVLNRKPKLPAATAADIAIDLLDALDHAHQIDAVHRDVKPDNVFLHRGRDGRHLAKLLDFGIIKVRSGGHVPETGARFVGTFRYAAPEQVLGRTVSAQSDLYSAGLVLFEMLAGRGPFDDFAGDIEVGKAQVDVMPPALSTLVSVPPELEAVVMACLAKDPAARPRSARELSDHLRMLKQTWAKEHGVGLAMLDRSLWSDPPPSQEVTEASSGAGFARTSLAPSANETQAYDAAQFLPAAPRNSRRPDTLSDGVPLPFGVPASEVEMPAETRHDPRQPSRDGASALANSVASRPLASLVPPEDVEERSADPRVAPTHAAEPTPAIMPVTGTERLAPADGAPSSSSSHAVPSSRVLGGVTFYSEGPTTSPSSRPKPPANGRVVLYVALAIGVVAIGAFALLVLTGAVAWRLSRSGPPESTVAPAGDDVEVTKATDRESTLDAAIGDAEVKTHAKPRAPKPPKRKAGH